MDRKVNAKDQPIYLYDTSSNDIPIWLEAICPGIGAGDKPPTPFATGDADLKVRITVVSDDYLEIFNSANGKPPGPMERRTRSEARLTSLSKMVHLSATPGTSSALTEIRR